MKGVVFTEFIEMVESAFSPEVADRIIEETSLASGGAYTAVGTYDHDEIIQLVQALSQESGVSVPDLVRTFGQHLFGRLVTAYPQFLEGVESNLDFLERVEDVIHVEVRKLYPDAELPTFAFSRVNRDCLELDYRSPRPFADLAEGLILGCAEHFAEEIELQREPLTNGPETHVRFTITCRH